VKKWVLDASAVLAYLNRERGREAVAAVLDGALLSTVNAAEVGTKLVDDGFTTAEVQELLGALGLTMVGFSESLAYRTAELRPAARRLGLSLGDRACLATARELQAGAVTTDRKWLDLGLDLEIQVIR
jgi:ribonuclease VapC